MMRKNGILGLFVVFVLIFGVASFGVANAQSPTAVPQQPAAQSPQPAQYPYLGVRLADTDKGVVVRLVVTDSPAAKAGLQIDDMVTKLNDTAVANVAEFADALNALKPGDTATIALTRAGKEMSLKATLDKTELNRSLVTNEAFDAIAFNNADTSWQVFGLAVRSDLASTGLHVGDTIQHFNGTAYNPAGLQTFRSGLADTDTVKLSIIRDNKPMDISVPAAAFKSLDLFDYAQQGMLFDLVAQTKTTVPAIDLANLQHNVPFDVFGFNLNDQSWRVYSIANGSDLAAAGLQPDDQITKFNDTVYDPASLQAFRDKLADSDTIKLTITRAAKSMDISVPAATLNSLHLFDYDTNGMLFGMPDNHFGPSIGVNTLHLTAAIATQHKITQTEGALVTRIATDSPAAMAGLQDNDVISAIDGTKIDAQHTLDSLLTTHKAGDTVKLTVMRGDKSMDISITLAKPDISGEIPFLIRPL